MEDIIEELESLEINLDTEINQCNDPIKKEYLQLASSSVSEALSYLNEISE